MKSLSIFWFRRDLRLHDNCALYQALIKGEPVLPIFIFDPRILNALEQKDDARVGFIYSVLLDLQQQLCNIGSTLLVFHCDVEAAFEELLSQYDVTGVYANSDYEPYGIKRDLMLSDLLMRHHVPLNLYKDHVIFEKSEVMKSDGTAYMVFSAYEHSWKHRLKSHPIVNYESENYLNNMIQMADKPFATLESIGFTKSTIPIPRLSIQTSLIEHYKDTRDYPWIPGTTRLGIHLRFGTVSIRQLVHVAQLLSPTFLSELIWREFFMMLLYHYPETRNHSYRTKFDQMKWSDSEDDFQAWCEGRTGYPIVDAGMRELNQTGFMNGRVRMIVASFLVKNLLIDWRSGEHYFAQHLLDYEMASNVGNWQWVASTGVDCMPMFRMFNPVLQAKKYDAQGLYQQQYLGDAYFNEEQKPIVELKESRQRYLSVSAEATHNN